MNRRILLVDDNKAVHEDFRKVFCAEPDGAEALGDARAAIFGDAPVGTVTERFETDSAYQGEDGLALVRESVRAEQPYAMAFVDMRMPPGWDGLETIRRIWSVDPNIQIVICTAYSDHSWHDIASTLGGGDRLLILKKPFDAIEARQLAWALTEKWNLTRQARRKHKKLDRFARSQSVELERRREKLERSEARLRAIVENAPDGIITVRENDIVESFNTAAEWIFGYAAGQIVGRDLSVLIPSLASGGKRAGLRQYLKTNKRKRPGPIVEVQGRRKDGREIPLALSVGGLRTGEDWVFTVIVRDMTERKQAEAIEHERNHLKDAVAALEQVLGVVGHELRTPLAGVRATAEFLLTAEAKELAEWDVFLMSIKTEIVRLADSVNNILEVARLDSGVAKWNWSVVPVETVSNEAVDSVRPLVDHQKVVLDCSVEPPDMTMNGDSDAIRRLIINLVSNACKHTAEGSVAVRVRAADEPDGPKVEIDIRDTGEGIAPETAARLGTPFALNAGCVGSNHARGSGLGLAICRGIVAAHGGTIAIASEPGTGTSVRIRLSADLAEPVTEAGEISLIGGGIS